MTNILFRSTAVDPFQRGMEFGSRFRDKIHENVAAYTALFARHAKRPVDLEAAGRSALEATRLFAPRIFEEMRGLAEGAGLALEQIGALNARTEILAATKASLKGECSAVLYLNPSLQPPVAVQTWDWYKAFEDRWLVWEIPQADGSVTKTMTEYGIVGKAGLNTRGIGLLFTILHHDHDGRSIGLPVHVAARAVLDNAPDIYGAAQLLARAPVSASSSINLAGFDNGLGKAMSVELYPGGPGFILPDEQGLVVHTNHFLAPDAASHDTEPRAFPDTLLRRDLLLRQLSALDNPGSEDVISVIARHRGGDGAVFCVAENGADPLESYETLSTVILDVGSGELRVLKGGPKGQQPVGHAVL